MQFCGSVAGILSLLITFSATAAFANNGHIKNARVCDEAIILASQEFDVPKTVLKAVARTESGITVDGSFVAWPWTINIEGRGLRFSSKSEAVNYFLDSYSSGARNIDLGCFQVNHRWHGDRFGSIDDMLNPKSNTRYAAKFLKELYFEFGNWTAAVGAFHSRTAKFSEKYLARYMPIYRDLSGEKTTNTPILRTVERQNQFPLLQGTSQSRSKGSLFPLAAGSGRGLLSSPGARG